MRGWWKRQRAQDDTVDVAERIGAVLRQALVVAAVAEEVRQAGRQPRPLDDRRAA